MGNPAAQKKAVVFTDPDCSHRVKLHMEQINCGREGRRCFLYKTLPFSNAQRRSLEIKEHPLQLFSADARRQFGRQTAEVLESGAVDFVPMSRPLIRQPDLPKLWFSGRGPDKAECLSCNACCP